MDTNDNSFPVMSLNTFNNSSYQEERKKAREEQLRQMEQAFATASLVQGNESPPDAGSVASLHSSPDIGREHSMPGASIRRARELVGNLRSGLSNRDRNIAPLQDDAEEHLPNSDLMEHIDDGMTGQMDEKKERSHGPISGFFLGCFYTVIGLFVICAESLVVFWGTRTRRQKIAIVAVLVLIPVIIIIVAATTGGNGGSSTKAMNGSNVDVPDQDAEPIDTERYETIRSNIVTSGLTSEEDIDAKGSAQNLALRWITDYDEGKLEPDHDAFFERYSLAVLFFSTFVTTNETHTVSTAGTEAEWFNSDHWMSDKGICIWHGVHCHAIIHEGEEEDHYNENSAIIQLNLTRNNIHGTLPSEIVSLENLKLLDLSANFLEGTIPPTISILGELENLYMMDNMLSGRLPEGLTELRELENMHFGNNNLEGKIPEGVRELRNLESLGLDQNYLTGTLPDLSKLDSLRILYLDKNELTGTIPVQYGSLAAMTDLRLAKNYLQGPIPNDLFKLDRLEILYLDENDLTGKIPDLFDSVPRLEEFHVYKNKLNGPLPVSLGNLPVLRVLYMDSNGLSGTIPTNYGQLDDLTIFYAYNNRLTGTIPTEIGGMKDLKDLRLYQNQLKGPVPNEIGKAFNLEVVYIQDNKLTGTIPASMGDLNHLKTFRLYRNRFQGEMPQPVCKLVDKYHLIFLAADCDEDEGSIDCECCHECYP